MLTFSVLTPCLNAQPFIAETVRSVLDQTLIARREARLQYIVLDGASDDNTCQIVEETFKTHRPPESHLQLISQPDRGMYDALANGLAAVTGDYCAYLNAGDVFSPHAFDIVTSVVQPPSIKWLTGLNTVYNEAGHMVKARLPYRYRRRLIRCGAYGQELPIIQQESTFWHASLNDLIDLDTLRSFRLAGDFYLWSRFATQAELYIVCAWLSGFRKHAGQQSQDQDLYDKERRTAATKRTLVDVLLTNIDRWGWSMSDHMKKTLNPAYLLVYQHAEGRYR